MSNALVQVPPDSTGKKIQTFENSISGQTVESQAVVIVGSDGIVVSSLPVTEAQTARTVSFTYNLNGTINTIVTVKDGKTRTDTYGYTGDDLTSITTVIT